MKSKWLISMGLVVCLLMAFALPMCAPAPPVEEKAPPVEEEVPEKLAPIRFYIGLSPDKDKLTADFISEHLGIGVLHYFMHFGEIHARLKAEAPRFSADMVIGCGSPQAFDAKKEGWSISYASPPWQGEGEIWRDPDNYWFNFAKYSFVLVGNENLLAEKGYTMPESWDELLDPKWKGQIVMPSPLTSGTAFMMLNTFMTHYGFNVDKGEEGGWEYLLALNKNIHHYAKGGNAPTDLVSRGEFMLGITSDAHILARLDEGYPLLWTVPKEGTGYEGLYLFILKGTKEEYTCQKVIDLLATKEFSEFICALTGWVSKDPAVPSPLYGEMPEYIPNIDLGWASENKARLLDEWKDRIGRVPAE